MASVFKVATGWRAQVRIKGKPTSSTIKATKAEANAWAREEHTRLEKSSSDNPNMTFGEVMDVYEEHLEQTKRSKRQCLSRIKNHFGDWRLTEIKSDGVSRFAQLRKRDGAGPATILQDITYLGTVLRQGGALAGSDEAQRARASVSGAISALRAVGAVADSIHRTRRPTEKELIQIEEYFAAKKRTRMPVRDMMLFAICTCLRMGEMMRLTFEDVDAENRLLLVRGRKDPRNPKGTDGVIPLLAGPVIFRGEVIDPLKIITARGNNSTGAKRIFPHHPVAVKKRWTEATNKCAIPDLRFHDLRHEGISRLFEAGYHIPQVALVSGHKTWKHLQRYTQINPATLHRDTKE